MASWFNPRAVTYNANPYLVAQSGAIGDTLYKLYTDARANKQEQERQNELKRQFEANFAENQRQFNENQKFKEREYQDSQNKIKFDNNLALQKFYLDQQKFKESKRQFNESQARELNNDLDLAIKQKNMPVSEQKDLKNVFTALEQTGELQNYVDEKGGWDKFGGFFDRFKTLWPNISQDGANYNALASNLATSTSEVLKGQGKFNYEKMNEDLKPSIVGTNKAQSTLNEAQKMLINRADELIKLAESQNYYGANEARENLNNIKSKIENRAKNNEKILSNTEQTPTQPLKNQEVLNINNIDLNAIEAELRRRGL
ncbi:hypothetical protein [Campylobacter devanensis]|uniref:hypothetical protein n=1 Tax=Campylobacter devanensis TaxID=3161138 RepID=UPI000A33D2AF|nr:hypothetical protein [Campylobacter sp. P0222]